MLNVSIIGSRRRVDFPIAPQVKIFPQYLNLLTTLGVGCVVDMFSDKRYGYPSIDESAFARQQRIVRFLKAGSWNIHCNFPWHNYYANYFTLPKQSNYWGFYGIGIGAEYLYSDRKSVAFDIETTGDMPAPLIGDIEYWGNAERINKSYISLTTNYLGGFYNVGIGLCATQSRWRYDWYELSDYAKTFYDSRGLPYPTPAYGTESKTEKHWSIGPECHLYLY